MNPLKKFLSRCRRPGPRPEPPPAVPPPAPPPSSPPAPLPLALDFDFHDRHREIRVMEGASAVDWFAEPEPGATPFLIGELCLVETDDAGPNWAAAAYSWELAAEEGSPHARLNLGLLALWGWGIDRDEARAIALWQQSAAAGDPRAAFNLGLAAELGWAGPVDYGRARHHYEQAPDHADALANLGALLAEGRGGAVAEARARDCWQRAAAQGQALAALKLAEEHRARAEAEVPLPDPFENLRVYRAPAPRPPEAAAHYRRAYHYYQIAGPLAVARLARARLQASGIGGFPDGHMALHDWEEAAAADDSDPQVQWGRRHPPPLGPPVENIPAAYEAARQYYEARARRAVVEAQYELASLYARGIYVEPDWHRARAWFERSARAGWPAAQYELARCCAAGLGGPRDLARAQLYYGKAAGHN